MDQAVAVTGETNIQSGQTLTFTWVGRRGSPGGPVAAPSQVRFQNITCGELQAANSNDVISCSADSSTCSLAAAYCCLAIGEGNLPTTTSDDWLVGPEQQSFAVSYSSQSASIGQQVGMGVGISLGVIAILVILTIVVRQRDRGKPDLTSHLPIPPVKNLPQLKRRRSQFRGDSCCEGGGVRRNSSDSKPSSAIKVMLTVVARRLSSCYCAYRTSNDQDETSQSEYNYHSSAPGLRTTLPVSPAAAAGRVTLRRCHSCPGLYCNTQPLTAIMSFITRSVEGAKKNRPAQLRPLLRFSHSPSIKASPFPPFVWHQHHISCTDSMLDDPVVSLLEAHWPVMGHDDMTKDQPVAPIDFEVDFVNDIEPHLGHLLGVGGFGRVYHGYWNGEEVAVKVCDIEHAADILEEAKLNAQVAGDRMVRVLAVAGLPAIQPASISAPPKGHMRAKSSHVNELIQAHHVASSSSGSSSGAHPATSNAPTADIVPLEVDLEAPPPVHQASCKVALILELCEGGTLSDYTQNRLPLSPLNCLLILHDIATGLAYLHSQGVIHRDIKPQNLLVKKGRVKLGDLGLSRAMAQSHLTVTRVGGTPHYSAPESFLGSKLTPKADVYSLGMVAYELATGIPPWRELRSEKPDAAMFRIILMVAIKGQRPPVPPDVHPCLAALITRAWKQDPQERPDASELVAIIEMAIRSICSSRSSTALILQ